MNQATKKRIITGNEPMSLDLGMPVQIGGTYAMIYGGPFRQYVPGTRRLVGVKMAAEINHPFDINIPTQDYSVPDVKALQVGLMGALDAIFQGNDIYAGCMGGIGRTGLFMGAMAKVMNGYNSLKTPDYETVDPVMYVRSHYHPAGGHVAIETEQQQAFIRRLDTKPVIDWLLKRDAALIKTVVKEVKVPVEVIKIVEVEKLITPWDIVKGVFTAWGKPKSKS